MTDFKKQLENFIEKPLSQDQFTRLIEYITEPYKWENEQLKDELAKAKEDNEKLTQVIGALNSHIERWAIKDKKQHRSEFGYCLTCKEPSPCPTELAKGWKE